MEYLSGFSSWCPGTGFWQGGGHGAFGGYMPFHFGGILQLVIIGLVVYFTVRLFRKPTTENGPSTPEDILKRRFARGEIDEPTYKAMKDELRNS